MTVRILVGDCREVLEWHGCYARGWGKELVPEAYAHPAKVSFSLAERIYQHAMEEGWLAAGSTIIDPFGGIGGFAYHAMVNGMHFVGVELEPRFVELANQNIALWNARYSRMPHWGSATMLLGDSRQLAALVGTAQACVSSPPWGNSLESNDEAFIRKAAADATAGRTKGHGSSQEYLDEKGTWSGYGHTPGNLGNMHGGGFSAAIASPPYTGEALGHDGACVRLDAKEDARRAVEGTQRRAGYGVSPGQLGAMRGAGWDAAVSSPPFGDNPQAKDNLTGKHLTVRSNPRHPGEKLYFTNYATQDSPGNLGNDTAFWPAARAIVEQVYQVVKPGGVAIWVSKRYVRAGAVVEFSEQWIALCEAVGFTLLHRHKAWLTEERGAQHTLDNGIERKVVKRVSFFRRLAERKGSPPIDWEDVTCMQKPAALG